MIGKIRDQDYKAGWDDGLREGVAIGVEKGIVAGLEMAAKLVGEEIEKAGERANLSPASESTTDRQRPRLASHYAPGAEHEPSARTDRAWEQASTRTAADAPGKRRAPGARTGDREPNGQRSARKRAEPHPTKATGQDHQRDGSGQQEGNKT